MAKHKCEACGKEQEGWITLPQGPVLAPGPGVGKVRGELRVKSPSKAAKAGVKGKNGKRKKAEAVKMLKNRVDLSLQESSAAPDVLFGLRTLLESDVMATVGPGRKGTLEDLKSKLEKVEGAHDAENLKTLSVALQTFLDEELSNEDSDEQEAGMADEEKPTTDAADKAAADGYKKYSDEGAADMEEALEARKRAAEADNFGKYLDEPTEEEEEEPVEESAEGKRCEACGAHMGDDEEKEVLPPIMESAEAEKEEECHEGKKESKRESDTIKVLQDQIAELTRKFNESRRPMGKFTEADRRELDELRAYKSTHQLKERARKALRKADLLDIYSASELMEFTESQWPVVVKMWKNAGPPQGVFVPRATEETPARAKAPVSAGEFFESCFAE